MKVETCENCGRTIGKLEQAYIFHENVVCRDCYAKLTDVEGKRVQDAIKKPIELKVEPAPPPTKQQESVTQQNEVRTNVKQGALLGGCVCFLLGLILMFVSLWSFILYVPFFLAAFILSIVSMAQSRVAGGVFLLIGTIIIPLILFFYKATEDVSKRLDKTYAAVEQAPKTTQEVQAPSIPVIGLGESVVIDEIKISVQSARFGFIETWNRFDLSSSKHKRLQKYLLIDLTLANMTYGKIVYLQNIWEKAKLIDNYNNIEGPKFADSSLADDIVVGCIGSAKINPAEVLQDMIIFEPPLDSATDFIIEVDPGFWKSVGEDRVSELSNSSFRIRFTRNQIQTDRGRP